MTSLGEWLESLGLAQYAEAFREHAIGWDVLSQLDHNLLKDIGVSAVGDRLRILRAVEALWPRDEKSETLVSRVPSSPHPGSGGAERRHLTVLFCDLVDSTELANSRDPEDLGELVSAYQGVCKSAIERYGGFVARYVGDGVLAYFGYPQAHEEDAERAVRAGLGIIDGIRKLNVRLAEGRVASMREVAQVGVGLREFAPVEDEAMRAGRLHIAGFGTGTVPIAVNCAGFVPFAIMGGEKGILGYEMEIIAAAIANEVMHRMMARDVVKKDQIVTVYKSETFPTAAFGLAHNLDPAVAAKSARGVLQLPVGRHRAGKGILQPGGVEVRPDHLPERLGRRPQGRCCHERQLRLQVARRGGARMLGEAVRAI